MTGKDNPGRLGNISQLQPTLSNEIPVQLFEGCRVKAADVPDSPADLLEMSLGFRLEVLLSGPNIILYRPPKEESGGLGEFAQRLGTLPKSLDDRLGEGPGAAQAGPANCCRPDFFR